MRLDIQFRLGREELTQFARLNFALERIAAAVEQIAANPDDQADVAALAERLKDANDRLAAATRTAGQPTT
jgi:hypothetical protein